MLWGLRARVYSMPSCYIHSIIIRARLHSTNAVLIPCGFFDYRSQEMHLNKGWPLVSFHFSHLFLHSFRPYPSKTQSRFVCDTLPFSLQFLLPLGRCPPPWTHLFQRMKMSIPSRYLNHLLLSLTLSAMVSAKKLSRLV